MKLANMQYITGDATIVRMASPESDELLRSLFRRYPEHEWASFARFGWRKSAGSLVLTLAALDPPIEQEMDESVGHVVIREPYSLRMALAAERHELAIGVIHSHPQDCLPKPSSIDDDMDTYYAQYFRDFAPGRPYVSLIASKLDDELVFSGRVFWQRKWYRVSKFFVQGHPSCTFSSGPFNSERDPDENRARLSAAFGPESTVRLRQSTVAVIGAGGTGSMAIEVLARAGVGRIVIVDPDHLEASNIERVHGTRHADTEDAAPKAALAARHVKEIDPTCDVQSFVGALPQPEIIDAVIEAEVVLGCTDQQHSRLALSDIAVRYLLPAIDCGVMLEGGNGKVTGQIVQLVRLQPSDPCVLCRQMTDPRRIATELMSPSERSMRQRAAQEAVERGDDPNPYWLGTPQLNTVGYLTGIAGAFAAAYAIGWITGRFDAPFDRLQMNIVAPLFDVQDVSESTRQHCVCRRIRGLADQGSVDALITAPSHWPAVKRL